MGQKIHPTGFRLPVTKNWSSRWYANSSNFAKMLNEDIEVRAFLKKKLVGAAVLSNTRLSAQKARLVADLVRGKSVEQALNILAFSPKKGAVLIKKVLESAIANAEHNEGADIDTLKVKTIYVDKGPSLKRFTARAKGRGNKIEKQTCHITLTVGD